MKICLAQTKSIAGNVEANIATHQKTIALAVSKAADLIIFPELSLTGYEPTLAKDLATSLDDKRFNIFQEISDNQRITICAGMPIRRDAETLIGMLIFQPQKERQMYAKQFLHEDELPYFGFEQGYVFLEKGKEKVALAICYELSIPEHSATAHQNHATIYIASVAKTASGVEKASKTLSSIAQKYGMTVLMANGIGYCDNFESAGNSAAWNREGLLIGQFSEAQEGILIIDIGRQGSYLELIQHLR